MNFTTSRGHKYIEYYEDELIQERIDHFAVQGVDLTDYKTAGTDFYSKWAKAKRAKSEDEDDGPPTLTTAEAEKLRAVFENEIGRVRGKRFLQAVK